jgi:Flp pilus assembly protein TadD
MNRILIILACAGALLAAGGCARPLALGPLEAGVAAAEEGRWDEAVRHWSAVIEQDPASAAAHNNLAVALERTGDWDGAEREYAAARRLAPDDPVIRANIESFHLRLEAGRRKAP